MLESVVRLEESVRASTTCQSEDSPLLRDYNFPLMEIGDLDELDERLKDQEFRNALFKTMLQIGGNKGNQDGSKICPRVLDNLVKPELQVQFSWKGIAKNKNQPTKPAFSHLKNFVKLVFEIVNMADRSYSLSAHEKTMNSLIKNARSRTEEVSTTYYWLSY